ncbi:MAG: hypothetical protein AAB653_01705 [Patescibacteria group bacterium]
MDLKNKDDKLLPHLAALFATCPPNPWRRRERETKFGGGKKFIGSNMIEPIKKLRDLDSNQD